jgi:hypothetical protein
MLTPVPYKPWYRSKILWAAVVTMLLGFVPLLLDFFKALPLFSVPVITAFLTLISGILTLIWRVFFTDQVIR